VSVAASSPTRGPCTGTTSLFAALEVATGKITADACYPRHTNAEFLAFLKLLAKTHPPVRLCFICDKYATYKHPPASKPGSTRTQESPCISRRPAARG
jgi:hypothetical protein